MTTAQHTPGPWEVYTNGMVRMKGSVTQVAEASLYLVDKYTGHKIDRAEQAANARLIAAAPELLVALRAALPYLDSVAATLVRAQAQAALDKAKGKE